MVDKEQVSYKLLKLCLIYSGGTAFVKVTINISFREKAQSGSGNLRQNE